MHISSNRRTAVKVGLAVAASLLLGTLASGAMAQGKEPLRFGVALPLTGSAAPFGTDQVQALEWAVADINAKGGAGGRKLVPVIFDHQAKPSIGVNMVTRLISVEKVPVLITAWSAVTAAIAPIVNRNETLALIIGANSPRIAHMGDYVYNTYPLADAVRARLETQSSASGQPSRRIQGRIPSLQGRLTRITQIA